MVHLPVLRSSPQSSGCPVIATLELRLVFTLDARAAPKPSAPTARVSAHRSQNGSGARRRALQQLPSPPRAFKQLANPSRALKLLLRPRAPSLQAL